MAGAGGCVAAASRGEQQQPSRSAARNGRLARSLHRQTLAPPDRDGSGCPRCRRGPPQPQHRRSLSASTTGRGQINRALCADHGSALPCCGATGGSGLRTTASLPRVRGVRCCGGRCHTPRAEASGSTGTRTLLSSPHSSGDALAEIPLRGAYSCSGGTAGSGWGGCSAPSLPSPRHTSTQPLPIRWEE
eukprot:COSAG01_NODE_585_length_15160_cov_15.779473_7_plen_189_part_00